MKLVLPLNIKINNEIKLPIQIGNVLQSKKITAVIEAFSIKEREEFFNVKDLRVEGSVLRYSGGGGLGELLDVESQDQLGAEYKVIISSDTINPSELRRIQYDLDFVFKLILGYGFKIYKLSETGLKYNNVTGKSPSVKSRRTGIQLNNAMFLKIKELFRLVYSNNSLRGRVDIFKFLIDTALAEHTPLGLTGAFFVVILESIFLDNENQELGNKFAMRFTKYKKEGLNYKKMISKFYGFRSRIFHSGNNEFTESDVAILETEACLAIENYLKNPAEFTSDKLDKLLLI